MRKRTLALILVISVHVLHAQEPGAHSIASLDFSAVLNGGCSVRVDAAGFNPSGPPMQVLTITCHGKKVLSYPTEDALVDIFLNYPHDDRVFSRWEGGSHVRFTVFRISGNSTVGTVVFDKQLVGTPDVVNSPDVLLVHNGKRFINGQATFLPISTDVYLWTGEQYVLKSSWKWKEGMHDADRFCVLDTKALACPVTPIPIK